MLNKYKQTAIFFLNIFRKNKRVSTYIFFFFVSFFFWFLSMLSKTHETVFEIPVEYINNPADLVSTAKPTNFINLSVKASGFSLVSYYLFNNKKLYLDYNIANTQLTTKGKDLFWIMNSKRTNITKIIGPSMEIMAITPQKVLVSFVEKNKKKVPVILDSDIKLKPSYWLADDINLEPSKIFIYGEQDLLNEVNEIYTVFLKLEDVERDQNHNISLIIPNGLESNNTFVDVELKVEPFVEDVFNKSIEIRDIPDEYSIKLFPDKVSVAVRLPKNKYKIFKHDMINIYVNASDLDSTNSVKVRYDQLPQYISLERIYPSHIEFLLIKE